MQSLTPNVPDPRGNRTKTTDVEAHVVTAEYDALGRKTKETDANGGSTAYEYDLAGHLTALVDANSNRTQFTYDGDGRLKTEQRADGKTWTYGYDAEGNRTSVVDPNGTTTTIAYDALNRVTGRTIARGAGVLGPAAVAFTLDPLGRMTGSSTAGDSAVVTEAFKYDSLDRLLREEQQIGSGPNRVVLNGYDLSGNLNALTYPSSLALSYDIDPLNRIAAIKQGGAPIATYRDVGSRPLDKTLANGITQAFTYDAGRRLNEVLSKTRAATVADIAYTLSPLGNKQTIARPDLGKKGTYQFNRNSQITQEALNLPIAGGTPERQTDYTIDKVLNYSQIQEQVNGIITATKTQTINNRNQYSAFAGSALTYDPNGNLSGGAGLSGTALAYDYENRLKRGTLSNGTVVENIFDASGRKVRESVTVSGTTKTTDYVLAGDQAIEQYAGSSLSARYVHGRGIDETVRAELDVNGDGTLESIVYPLQDELGNVERLTDVGGATVERYDYQGYGKPRIFDPSGGSRSVSSFGWRWLFQGREYQGDLNAYDFRARELWPDLARFGQEDPFGFSSSANRYQAFLGDEILLTDPFGLQVDQLEPALQKRYVQYTDWYNQRVDAAQVKLRAARATRDLAQIESAEIDLRAATRADPGRFRNELLYIQYKSKGVFGYNYEGVLEASNERVRAFLIRQEIEAGLMLADLALVGAAGLAADAGVAARFGAEAVAENAATTISDEVIAAAYRRYYTEAAQAVVRRFNVGQIRIPAGMSWETVLGQQIDAVARRRLRGFLMREGAAEGPGADVLVNRWLRDPAGSGKYRIPDLVLRRTRRILDGTIGDKTSETGQVQDFVDFSGGYQVEIVRPEVAPFKR